MIGLFPRQFSEEAVISEQQPGKKRVDKGGIEHTVWEEKTILEETRMKMKKLDSG